MKLSIARCLALIPVALLAAPLCATTITANFDSLDPFGPSPGMQHSESGIQFVSPSNFNVVSGNFAAVLFGGGGYTYTGNALSVANDGWVGISTPGSYMQSVSFDYGFDWNFFVIENGLMDTFFEWQTVRDGSLLEAGKVASPAKHGGSIISVSNPLEFDLLLIRSTAIAYEGIFSPDGIQRGEVIGYGDANYIAFDNVSVELGAKVPDGGIPTGGLAALLLVAAFVRRRKYLG